MTYWSYNFFTVCRKQGGCHFHPRPRPVMNMEQSQVLAPPPPPWTRCIDGALARSRSQLFFSSLQPVGIVVKTEGQYKNRVADNRASKGASGNPSSIGPERLCPRAWATIWEACGGWSCSFHSDRHTNRQTGMILRPSATFAVLSVHVLLRCLWMRVCAGLTFSVMRFIYLFIL